MSTRDDLQQPTNDLADLLRDIDENLALHDRTGDPHDEGYSAALNDVRRLIEQKLQVAESDVDVVRLRLRTALTEIRDATRDQHHLAHQYGQRIANQVLVWFYAGSPISPREITGYSDLFRMFTGLEAIQNATVEDHGLGYEYGQRIADETLQATDHEDV